MVAVRCISFPLELSFSFAFDCASAREGAASDSAIAASIAACLAAPDEARGFEDCAGAEVGMFGRVRYGTGLAGSGWA